MIPSTEENNKIVKFVVKPEHEIVDIVRFLKSSKANRIILTFADESDILISPINFKVIQKSADDEEKTIIAQIIQNNAGVANANYANVTTHTSPSDIEEDLWKKAERELARRISRKNENLKKKIFSSEYEATSKKPVPQKERNTRRTDEIEETPEKNANIETPEENTDQKTNKKEDDLNIEDFEKEDGEKKPDTDFQDRISKALEKLKDYDDNKQKVLSESSFTLALDQDITRLRGIDKPDVKSPPITESVADQDLITKRASTEEHTKTSESNKYTREKESSMSAETVKKNYQEKSPTEQKLNKTEKDYKQKFQQANERRESAKEKTYPQYIKSRTTSPTEMRYKDNESDNIKESSSSFVGKDFRTIDPKQHSKKRKALSESSPERRTGKRKINFAEIFGDLANKVGSFFTSPKFSKGLLKLIIPFLMLSSAIFFFLYMTLPQATVTIHIQAKPISIERTFTGKSGSTFSLESNSISIKKESVNKEFIENGTATGTGTRGDLASGIINIHCKLSEPDAKYSLPAKTTLTSKANGLKYETTSAITDKLCPSYTPVNIQAKGYGEEYNLTSNSSDFTIEGKPEEELLGRNSSAIDGGSKETFTKVSDADIKTVEDSLKKTSKEEAIADLKEQYEISGWILIEDTISHKVDGDPEVNPEKNSEAETFDITMKTKTTAYFYNKNDVENAFNDLIKEETESQNLFGGATDFDLSQDLDIDYKASEKDGTVTVIISAEGTIKPSINRSEIADMLEGKSWKEGSALLENFAYTSRESDLLFEPKWFPKFLWKFPAGRNKITVKIIEDDYQDDGDIDLEFLDEENG